MKILRFLASALAVALTATAAPAMAASDPAVVRTEAGQVRGTLKADHRLFQGIPYAAPPVGALRWGSPRPAAPWTGVREATRPGPSCPQDQDFIGDKPSVIEDCLYLNVTTPRHITGRLPVMVWIHGGGFLGGSGAIYGAQRLATQGEVIVVTFNYRLGALGFLAHPALNGGAARHGSGNFGIEDQQAVLRWVRANAAGFGGDPNNITIFGESAGGMSSCAHLTAPSSRGLFDRVIMMSGPCTLRWPWAAGPAGPQAETWRPKPRAQAQRQAIEIATAAGCGDPRTAAACLRAKPVPALLKAVGPHGLAPAYGGGGVLPDDPVRRLKSGQFARVPVMHGITRDEHVTFQVGFDAEAGPLTAKDYPAVLGTFLGLNEKQTAKVIRRYPLSDYRGSTSWAMAGTLTDWAWACPAAETNDLLSRHVPTYAYEFADRGAPWFKEAPPQDYPTGAYHAGELQYLFSGAYAGHALSPEQRQLSDQMIGYWTRFAHSGDPGWAKYRPADGQVLALAPGQEGIKNTDLAREHRCDFWKSVG
ncbi:para-nitrobenzyl esterase [Nonomuraea solani]|uniref:Carboxylic ester hydrolase n=1 Tax=Nonomuraea solani TaxID=1144553 RepID=A0A1H6EH70_9ACTN|nr:carboxylesterase family protein [Nonomuraea solani]SEG96175.1 para-nitrobenzyl esterase [Nonomuraea solani]